MQLLIILALMLLGNVLSYLLLWLGMQLLSVCGVLQLDLFNFSAFVSFMMSNSLMFKISNSIIAFGTFAFPPMMLARFYLPHPLRQYNLQVVPTFKQLTYAAMIMFACLPLVNLLASINSAIKLPDFLHGVEQWMLAKEEMMRALQEMMGNANTLPGLLLSLITLALIPAFVEELFFRGWLQGYFFTSTQNKHLSIWLTAIIFSAIHFQFYGFIPRMLLGLLMGYVCFNTGSLYLAMMLHFVNNGACAVGMYAVAKGWTTQAEVDAIGTMQLIWPTLLGLPIVYYLLLQFKEKEKTTIVSE